LNHHAFPLNRWGTVEQGELQKGILK